MSVFFIAPCVHLLASLPINVNLIDEKYLLLICAIVYLVITSICIIGGKIFWNTKTLLGVTVIVFVLLYQIGSLPNAKLNTDHAKKVFQFGSVMHYIPDMASVFLGIQFLPLTCKCAKKPKTDIPLMMIIVMSCSILTGLGFMLLAASHPPDLHTLASDLLPLSHGFSRILSISLNAGKLMNIPFLVSATYGFIFFCGRQMWMMAKSGLLPTPLMKETPYFDTPYVSLLTVATSAFILNIIGYFRDTFIAECFRVSSLASFLVFISAMMAYIVFHAKYSLLERAFHSPLQTPGAYLGILIFLFCFIGGSIYHPISAIIVAAASVIALIYSFFFGKIVFSEEEKEEMFKAYLVNANRAAKKRMKKGRSHSSAGGSKSSRVGGSRNNHDQRSECSDSESEQSNSRGGNDSNFDLESGSLAPPRMVLTKQLLTAPVTSVNETNIITPSDESEGKKNDGTPEEKESTELAPTMTISPVETVLREASSSKKQPTTSILQFLSAKFNQVSPESVLSV